MKKALLTSMALLLFAAAVVVSPALAKGPAQLVEIDIPGFYHPLRIEDEELLEQLSFGRFEDLDHPVGMPTNVGAGLVLSRYFIEEDGNELLYNRVVYFTDHTGGTGYAFFLGFVHGSSEHDGRWFPVRPAGQEALIQALEVNDVHLKADAKASETSATLVAPQRGWLVVFGLAASFGLGWVVASKRRARN